MDDIAVEQRIRKFDGQQLEMHLMQEMEHIQTEIDQAVHSSESNNKINENLKKEVSLIENAIAEKKKQLEKLVNEMKEVNLQSLTATSTEEIRHLLEGIWSHFDRFIFADEIYSILNIRRVLSTGEHSSHYGFAETTWDCRTHQQKSTRRLGLSEYPRK